MTSAALFAGAVLYSSPAAAQATRTWVSGVGDDANPCSRTAPCKTFAGAISKTAAGGEINCLDPAGFGTLTITKSIIVDCTNTLGGVLASSTTGFIVNAAVTDNVVLRGLTINGGTPVSPGINGVRVLQAKSVLIEDTVIENFGSAAPNGNGILINPATGAVRVTVANSTIVNNLNGGIVVNPAAAVPAALTVINTKLIGNGGAAINLSTAGGGTILTATVTGSQIDGAGAANSSGVITKATVGTAFATIKGSTIVGNVTFGVNSNGAGSTVRVSATTITGNATGVNTVSGGQAISSGNNEFFGNTTQGAFTSTVPLN